MQILIFLLLLLPGVTYAQKHDNIWILGYGGGTQSGSNDSNGLSIINFDLAFQMQNNQTCNLNLTGTNSGFCDSLGNLLMVCNGEKVYHGGLNLMINGGGLNATNGYGTAQPQGALTLPWPEHPNLYVLLVVEVKTFSPQLVTGFKLYYNLLNINSDDPVDSEVVVKKQLIIQDSMENGQLSACKHANGRDWWILMPESHSNRYYTFLLDPSGLSLVDTQAVGDVFFAGLGQAVFTPDGSKYLRVNGNDLFEPNHLYLYDFDRCTGKLSNPLHWEYEPGGLGMGCAISHNSRILYAAMNAVKLIQYDLWAPDVESSGVVVGEYDGYIHEQHFYTAFSIAQLAPDGRIYMSTNGSTPFLHVIDHPGRRGAACGFRQRGLHLFNYNSYSIPNHPNYRLGPIDGSACDTLGLNNYPLCRWQWQQEDTINPLAISFTNLSDYEPVVWQWDFGDGAMSQDTSPVHAYAHAGVYEVCLTVSNAYGSDTLCRVLDLSTVGAEENPDISNLVSVGPNPFGNYLSVALSVQLRNPVFSLYDQTGRIVRNNVLVYWLTEVKTADLPAGLYFWEVRSGSELVQVGKAVKID